MNIETKTVRKEVMDILAEADLKPVSYDYEENSTTIRKSARFDYKFKFGRRGTLSVYFYEDLDAYNAEKDNGNSNE